MKSQAIQEQLSPLRLAFVEAVAQAVSTHVGALRESGTALRGYAVLCNELSQMIDEGSLAWIAAVYDCEGDAVEQDPDAPDFARFFVDGWEHWPEYPPGFAKANARLGELNAAFRELHPATDNDDDDFELDDAEADQGEAILQAALEGVERARGAFGEPAPFLAVWISDDDHPIVQESIERLNSEDIAEAAAVVLG
jgi:hypothetical protein